MNRWQDDLRSIDLLLEELAPPLEEATKALNYPEVFGLLNPNRQDRALKSLRTEIERVERCVRQARELTELAWLDPEDLDPEPQAKAVETGS